MPNWIALYVWIDRILIFFYRLFDNPFLGYLFGTAVLCLMCVVLGQLTLAAVFLWNRRRIDDDNREMVRMHNLSIRALRARDKRAYKACNKEANEAFGKVFFTQIAMSLSSLWPVPFALAWMQNRFSAVDFTLPVRLPFIGHSVGYLFSAIPIYILVYILFGKIKSKLPFFRNIARILAAYDHADGDEMIRLAELPRESARRSSIP
jgi:hypothetical protein